LERGFAIVGSVPATYDSNGNVQSVGQGSLIILNRSGQQVAALTNPNLIDGPWGMAINDQGSTTEGVLAFKASRDHDQRDPPSGLQDTLGRFIDGDHNGTPAGNAVAVFRRSGVVKSAISLARSNVVPSLKAATADALLERGELMGVMPFNLASTSPRTNHSHQA
jgi:hypothetical protein